MAEAGYLSTGVHSHFPGDHSGGKGQLPPPCPIPGTGCRSPLHALHQAEDADAQLAAVDVTQSECGGAETVLECCACSWNAAVISQPTRRRPCPWHSLHRASDTGYKRSS